MAGVLPFWWIARLGVRRHAAWLVAGWALHVGWDLGLHGTHTTFVPAWYPPVCLFFDLAAALWIGWRMRAWRPTAHQATAEV